MTYAVEWLSGPPEPYQPWFEAAEPVTFTMMAWNRCQPHRAWLALAAKTTVSVLVCPGFSVAKFSEAVLWLIVQPRSHQPELQRSALSCGIGEGGAGRQQDSSGDASAQDYSGRHACRTTACGTDQVTHMQNLSTR